MPERKASAMLMLGKKRKRCGTCSGCTGEDCKACKFCKDNPRYGGPGKKKQCCVHRRCTQLQKETFSMSAPQDLSAMIAQLKQHMVHIVLPLQSTINLEDNTVIPPPRTEEYSSVTRFLLQQDRTIDHITSDGNCMFTSISKELFGTQCHHVELRKLILNFEEDNPNIIRSLSKDTVQVHLDKMRRECEWGSATELVALASMLQVPVFTYTNSVSHTYSYSWHRYSPLQLENLSFQFNPAIRVLAKRFTKGNYHIELLHYSECHYGRIVSLTKQLLLCLHSQE